MVIVSMSGDLAPRGLALTTRPANNAVRCPSHDFELCGYPMKSLIASNNIKLPDQSINLQFLLLRN